MPQRRHHRRNNYRDHDGDKTNGRVCWLFASDAQQQNGFETVEGWLPMLLLPLLADLGWPAALPSLSAAGWPS